jgi:hypothetical protein
MSHEIDDCYQVYQETERAARKPHVCSACREPIRVGDKYCYVWIVDGDSSTEQVRRCLRCQKIHEHLRKLDPGNMWPDERLDCGEGYDEHWGEEPPQDIAALAFATADEMQARRRA